jgi:hypothetical protein
MPQIQREPDTWWGSDRVLDSLRAVTAIEDADVEVLDRTLNGPSVGTDRATNASLRLGVSSRI